MRKILVLVALTVFGAACASQSTQVQTTADGKKVYYSAQAASQDRNAKYKIIDQEFDNMLAPDSDYDTLSDYELQACGTSYLPPAEKLKKPQVVAKQKPAAAAAKVTTNKKVTNTTNIYYLDEPISQAPTSRKYSSTTTTTSNSSSYSSASSFDDEEYEDDMDMF